MKKIVALFLTLVLAVSCMASAFASDTATTPTADGFDFYSMTIHYAEPVVLGYTYNTSGFDVVDHNGNPLLDDSGAAVHLKKGYLWAEPSDTLIVPVVYYNKDGVTNQTLAYNGDALKNNKHNKDVFYAVIAKNLNIDSSHLTVLKSFGLSDIADGDVITAKESVAVYGAGEYYDDAGVVNPNFTKDADGYFVDKEVDENGANLRIDDNGYKIDANGIWHSIDGHRIEPFIEIDDTFVWVSLENRMIDGKIANLDKLTNQYFIDKGIIQVAKKFALIGDSYDNTVDYNGDGTITNEDKTEYNSLVKEKKVWLSTTSVSTFVVDYIDADGDGKVTDKDLPENNKKETTYTADNIMKKKQKDGTEIPVYGTPVMGTPKTKVQISKITIEIDALGSTLYSDVASDPQQQNEIIVTYGDVYANVKLATDYVAEHPEKEYKDGAVVGTAKCVTTKTEVAEADGIPSTVKSVDLVMEENVELPTNVMFYFNFVVKTAQPENTKTYIAKKDYNLLTINRQKLDVESLPDAPKTDDGKQGCGNMIGGGIALVSLAACAFVALRKKED